MITHLAQRMSVFLLLVFFGFQASAQTSPPDGLRDNTPSVHAFTNARIVQAPGRVIENGTLVIRDGIIESAGDGPPPDDALIWDLNGRSIYPGLIDMYSHYGLPKPPERSSNQESENKKPKVQKAGMLSWNGHVIRICSMSDTATTKVPASA